MQRALLRAHLKERILLLQLAKMLQQRLLGQRRLRLDLHAHDGHELRRRLPHACAEDLARPCRQPGDSARFPGLKRRHDAELRPLHGVERVGLARPLWRLNHLPGQEPALHHLHIG